MPTTVVFAWGVVFGALLVSGILLTFPGIRAQLHRVARRADLVATQSAMGVLNALSQYYVLLSENNHVDHASSQAYVLGLVTKTGLHTDMLTIVDEVRSSWEAVDKEIEHRVSSLKGSSTRRIAVRVTPYEDDKVLVLFRDVTEQRRLDETRRDFVANVSHELKTPVGSIKLLAETLHGIADEPEIVREFTAQLENEANRLDELVRDIIQLSQLQDYDALSHASLVHLGDVIEKSLERERVAADKHSIHLASSFEPDLCVYGDAGLLVTAIRNLIDNAIRYSDAGTKVTLNARASEDTVEISVADTGKGIPPQIQDRIFERFYRGDEARSRDTGGSGLGLSIVKHIVSDHGGSISLRSEVGTGSTFTITLPKAVDADAMMIDVDGRRSADALDHSSS
ncbi:MAG: ATP-binding protein [Arcanobacterium sp.]|nr:ATP-binding protein [Arcanobacterium sp.]MDY6143685.1 ATP-binding protein [Arcanobacterium sp.]